MQEARQHGSRNCQYATSTRYMSLYLCAAVYQAATKQNRKLKAVLAQMERLSGIALARMAKPAENTD